MCRRLAAGFYGPEPGRPKKAAGRGIDVGALSLLLDAGDLPSEALRIDEGAVGPDAE